MSLGLVHLRRRQTFGFYMPDASSYADSDSTLPTLIELLIGRVDVFVPNPARV